MEVALKKEEEKNLKVSFLNLFLMLEMINNLSQV